MTSVDVLIITALLFVIVWYALLRGGDK